MGGDMPQKERIQAALALIKNSGFLSKEDANTLEAVLYVLAAKFLGPSELEEIKEVMRMTLLGEMLVEEGRSQGLTEGHAAMVTEILRRKLAKGFSPESIAELLELDPAYIKKIYTMIQDNPNETDLQIAQALIKGK